MFPVNHQQYRELYELGEHDPIPPVELWSNFYELQEELDNVDEMCFVRTTAQFFRDEITLEDYFDRLIGHLEVDAARHTFDNATSTKLDNLFRMDLISGAVKCLMLDQSFQRLQATDSARFKKLCILAYRIEDGEALCREAAAADAPLESLPPCWVDVLAVIAYARRHVSALQQLVTYPGPSTKSTFDQLGSLILAKRREPDMAFQHSADTAENRLVEIRLWMALLQAEGRWIHFPLEGGPEGLDAGLQWLVDFFKHEPQLRASPDVEKLCKVYSDLGVVLCIPAISRFMSITAGHHIQFPNGIVPCGLALATMIISYFPLSRVAAKNDDGRLGRGESADLLLPLTQWGAQNPDRLTVMRMLLEQGCDPNDKIHDWGWPGAMTAQQHDTALHLAAQLGDAPVVDLLMEFGARGDSTTNMAGEGDTPVERARRYGYLELAARIAG